MNTAAELIRRIDFFQPLDDRTVNQIARVCIVREYSPGDHIVRQGDSGLGLYFITRGHARVEMEREGVSTLIAELSPGEFVGELSIIDKKPRLANVICTTETSCLLLTRDRFTKLLHKYPEIAMQMAKALAARLRTTDEWLLQGAATAAAKPAPQPVPIPPARTLDDRQRLKSLLADTVGWFYLLKSITQVSLAVVGCPVTVSLETQSSESCISAVGPLKIISFPAHENHVIGVHAFGGGAFSAMVLQRLSAGSYAAIKVSRFTTAIQRNDSSWLHVPASFNARIEGASKALETHTTRPLFPPHAKAGMRELQDLLSAIERLSDA